MRTQIAYLFFVAAVLAFGGLAGTAKGELILGNGLDPPYRQNGTVFNDQQTLKGMGLQMKSDAYTFDRFSVVLEYMSGQPQATGHIYADDGLSRPGVELMTLNAVQPLSGEQAYDFVPPSPFTLAANTKYWFVVSDGPTVGWFRWDRRDPTVNPTGVPADFVSYQLSEDGGAHWAYSSILCATEVHGTYIPEPATLALVALGGLALVRRRGA